MKTRPEKITLVNGNPDPSNITFEEYLDDLAAILNRKGCSVDLFDLKELKVIPCTGCWGCWVRTPGECLFEDDMVNIRRSTINADVILFASPLIMGFTSAMLKKAQDKLIPLLHPYIELVHNECHHIGRYENYPAIALIYQKETDTDGEDLLIVTDIYRRFALNFKSELLFARSTDDPAEIIYHEMHHH